MKIKVKRYKQLEKIAVFEALEQILSENSKHGSKKLDKVIKTLEEAGLSSKVLQLVKEHLNLSDVAKSSEGEI